MNKTLIIILVLSVILLNGCITPKDTAPREENLTETPNETIEQEIEEEYCDLKIGYYCCEYSEKQYSQRIWGLCEDKEEIEAYKGIKEKAYKRYPSAGGVEFIEKLALSFEAPENWYIMKDYKMAGMDVPLSYIKSTDPKNPSKTEVEIRFVYYENKDELTIEEFKEKLVQLLTNGQIKKTMPKSYSLPFNQKSISERWKMEHEVDNGIWFEVWEYGDYEENYYWITILDYKGHFYPIIFKDPFSREMSSYYSDSVWKAFEIISGGYNFMDITNNTHYIQMKNNWIAGSSLNFKKPTEVRYKIKTDGRIDFYFVKSWDDFDKYVKNQRDEKFEYYEDCKHIDIEDEVEGSCMITKSRFAVGNLQQKEKNVTIELDWS